MAYQVPLVLVNGQIEQLQSADMLDPSAVLAGTVGPSGPSGPVGPSTGAAGPTGAAAQRALTARSVSWRYPRTGRDRGHRRDRARRQPRRLPA